MMTYSASVLCHQITRAPDSSPLRDPPSHLPSPGHHSVPTKHLVSTDTFRKVKKTITPQNQQPATETLVPKLSSQPHTLCSPTAALPKIDVSSTLSSVLIIALHLYTASNMSSTLWMVNDSVLLIQELSAVPVVVLFTWILYSYRHNLTAAPLETSPPLFKPL